MSRSRRRTLPSPSRDNRRVDLHMHSVLSDGKLEPQALIDKALERKLDIMAITDHDIAPSLRAQNYGTEEHTLRLIHGVELSVNLNGSEQHFLAYFPEQMPQVFRDSCTEAAKSRALRYEELRQATSLDNVDAASPEALEGKKALTRLHLAQAIVKAGHAKNISQAFSRWLKTKEGVSHFPDAVTCIHKVKAHGGICIWAHPSLDKAAIYADKLKSEGLDGLEVYRPYQKKNETRRMRSLCNRLDLLCSGGSDTHSDSVGLFSFPAEEILSWPSSFSFQIA